MLTCGRSGNTTFAKQSGSLKPKSRKETQMSQEHLSLVEKGKIKQGELTLAEARPGAREKFLALDDKEEERETKEGPIKYYECEKCFDLGMEIVIIDGVTRGARPCACRERKRILEKLAQIPTAHRHVEWNSL